MKSDLSVWFDTLLGQHLLIQEQQALQDILPQLFGYHLLQVGCLGDAQWLASSRIKHRVILATEYLPGSHHTPSARADADSLPIAGDSMDVVVLAHILEFEPHPHQVLREVERVLIPEGHMILIGFNPLSLWGLRRLLEFRARMPWQGHFRTTLRMHDWLALLGFELISQKYIVFTPPLSNDFLQRRMAFLETCGKHGWPYLGAVYVMLAKKRVATLTPIKPSWLRETQKVFAGAPPARPGSIRRENPRDHEE